MHSILYVMAVSCARAGRPCLVADIDFSKDSELAFWDEFFGACSDFHYAEIMAVSRAFGVNYHTVEKWKYRIQFPRKGVAQQIIDWVNRGKPMRKISPSQTISDML